MCTNFAGGFSGGLVPLRLSLHYDAGSFVLKVQVNLIAPCRIKQLFSNIEETGSNGSRRYQGSLGQGRQSQIWRSSRRV